MHRLLCCVLLALTGCVSMNWRRNDIFIPPSPEALDRLQPGVTTLDECLASMGAPLFVWEYKGDGMALAYGASHGTDAGVRVSIPVAEYASVSLDYSNLRAKLRGAVLFFDASLKLEHVRRGYLRDIDGGLGRRRPAFVPEASVHAAPGSTPESATNEG